MNQETEAKLIGILLKVGMLNSNVPAECKMTVIEASREIMALVVSTIPGEETGVTDDDESEACKYGWNSCRDRMLETWTEGKK